MLTLFSVPKPFRGHIDIIQRNGIESWRRLSPTPHIVLLGDEAGTADTAANAGAQHVPHLERDAYGTPSVQHAFQQGEAHATTDVVCYVNTDIILFDCFMRAVQRALAVDGPFLLIGQRTDYDVTAPLVFTPGWADELRHKAQAHGTLHKPQGIDYFVYRRGTMGTIPPFALGRWRWDNWLVWNALRRNFAVVDVTGYVVAVHQNHDYSHHDEHAQQQLRNNDQLIKHTGARLSIITDASHIMTRDGNITLKSTQIT